MRSYTSAIRRAANEKIEKSQSPGFDLLWTVRGPANVGARVNTIAVHPTDPDLIYIGYSAGGLFKTTDGGANWTPVFDDQPFLAIGDIAFDPQDPSVVYVGTGDPNISGYPFIGDGLYRSADEGLTWEHLGLTEQRIISKVIVHPRNSKVIYVATMGLPFLRNRDRGLYRSRDGGDTWEQILFVEEGAGVIDLIMDPENPSTLYAVSWDRVRNNRETTVQGPNSRIYKSTDGGEQWSPLGNGLPQGETGRIALAIAPSNPAVLAALYLDENDELYNIYRTEDRGENWLPIIDQNADNGLPSDPLRSLGWYLGRIAFHPDNDQDLFMLGIRLWRTEDNGRNWYRPTANSSGVHVDNHDIVFDAEGSIYLATDGGLYRSTDNGDTWEDAENIATTQFYRTAHNPHQPDWYYGGAQDNGTLGGFALEEDWTRIFGADGFQMQFHPEKPEVFYVEIQGGRIYYTNTGGAGWRNGISGIDGGDRRNWDAPYQISAHRPSVLYTGTYRLYKSESDGAPRWRPISEDLTKGDLWGGRFNTISTLHESPVDFQLLYVGTSDGLAWRTRDGGENWEMISGNLPDRYVTSVKASPFDENQVVITHSGYRDNDFAPHIHLSEDRGETWTAIAGNLPPLAINDVYLLPETEDEVIFAATDGGVYATINRGRRWERLGVNMPVVPTYDLEWNPARNELVAATFGRSIQSYALDDLIGYWRNTVSVGEIDLKGGLNVYPNPTFNDVRLDVPGRASFTVEVFDTDGRRVFYAAYDSGAAPEIQLGDRPAGVYYVRVEQAGRSLVRSLVKL